MIDLIVSIQNKELVYLNTNKRNNPIKKWAEDMNRYFSKDDTDGQQTHEKMLNFPQHQNANQSHNEISPHTCQNG